MYKSPNSNLLEVINVGFRGLSGAIAVVWENEQPLLTGMLLKRGLPMHMPFDFVPSNDERNSEFASNTDICNPEMKGILAKLDALERKLLTLEQKALRRDDLENLLNITSMRRSIIMPVQEMVRVMEDCVPLESLVGKAA